MIEDGRPQVEGPQRDEKLKTYVQCSLESCNPLLTSSLSRVENMKERGAVSIWVDRAVNVFPEQRNSGPAVFPSEERGDIQLWLFWNNIFPRLRFGGSIPYSSWRSLSNSSQKQRTVDVARVMGRRTYQLCRGSGWNSGLERDIVQLKLDGTIPKLQNIVPFD